MLTAAFNRRRHAYEQHGRSQSWVRAVEIGVGNMVVVVAQIHGGAATRVEQLHTTSELRGKVELLLCAEHPPVEIEESAPAGNKRLHMPDVQKTDLQA